jgi:signal transduction histidine kinase
MTLRFRIALLLVVGMLVTGVIALTINASVYQQSVYSSPTQLQDAMLKELGVSRATAEAYVRAHPESVFDSGTDRPVRGGQSVNGAFQNALEKAQRDATRRSRRWSVVVIAVLAIITGVAGWFIAGRALRPVRLLTSRARTASAADLSARVDLKGPDDELKDLADTFDAMLARLERSFTAQRRFSAQASHELRTPLAVIRSETDLLLAESADGTVRRTAESIRAATMRAEKLVTALLALGRSESGYLDCEELDLDELIGDTVAEVLASPSNGVRVDLELHSARVVADRALLDCLTRNVLDNAVRHNRPEGWVEVRVDTVEGRHGPRARLEVRNSAGDGGGAVPTGPTAASAGAESHGIGLTVVDAIVSAHGGALELTSSVAGVFMVRVLLPMPAGAGAAAAVRGAERHVTSQSLVTTDRVPLERH